jgi:hypothetical protein
VLRRIFGPKRDEEIGAWSKLCNWELCCLYSHQVKDNNMGTEFNTNGDEESVQVIGEKAREKEPLGRPRCSCLDIMKMDLEVIDWVFLNWIGLAQNREKWRVLVNAVMKLHIYKMLGKYRMT